MANKRVNTPTEQNKEDNGLLLYRLELVETAVKDVSSKIDKQDNLKRRDLVEFRDTIITRFNEIRDSLQKQVDEKADKTAVDDVKTLIKAVGSILGSIIAGLVIFYVTRTR